MLSIHLTCLLLLFCFAQSKPAENDEASTKGTLWKIKETGRENRRCFCGNVRLPNYDKGVKDHLHYEKFRGFDEDHTDFEQTKSKMGHKKCLCFKQNVGLDEKEADDYDRMAGGAIYKPVVDSYQIDRYQDMTDKPDYLTRRNDLFVSLRKQRVRRSSEMDKTNGGLMKFEEQLNEGVGAIVKKAKDVVSGQKSAEDLQKVGYGLGVASDVVQKVGERVGSTFGGQMAKSVLDQVSFGLGLASNAAQSAADNKGSNGGRRKRSIGQTNSERSFEKMTSPRISGEGFIQMWRKSQASHHQTANTMMMMKPAVRSLSSNYSTKSSAGLKS